MYILTKPFFNYITSSKGLSAEGQNQCETLQKIFETEVESENEVCSVEIVREKLQLTHIGKKISPKTMEIVFHFSFETVHNQTAVMGELALLEEEVNPVIAELRKGNLEVSALFKKLKCCFNHS